MNTSPSYKHASRKLLDFLALKPEHADLTTWQEALGKFNYSDVQVLQMQQGLPGTRLRGFLCGICLMVIYRVIIKLRPRLEGNGGANPNVVVGPLGPTNNGAPQGPPVVVTGTPLTLEAIAALLSPVTEELKRVTARVWSLEANQSPSQTLIPGTGSGNLRLSAEDRLEEVVEGGMSLTLRNGLADMSSGLGAGKSSSVSASSVGSGSSNDSGNKRSSNPESGIEEGSKKVKGTFEGVTSSLADRQAEVSGSWWIDTESKLRRYVNFMHSIYSRVTHVSVPELRDLIYKLEHGLDSIDAQGVPTRYHVPPYKRNDMMEPKLKSEILNPDFNGDLLELGDFKDSAYIVPATVWHWLAFMESQGLKILESTCMGFKQKSSGERAKCLITYRHLFLEFAEGKMGPKENFHKHAFHVTNWALL
eukprot:gene41190-50987_t